MTNLAESSPVRRETPTYKRDGGSPRPIVIELHPSGALVRLKGRRTAYGLSYEAIYDAAVRAAVRAARAEKQQKKRGR